MDEEEGFKMRMETAIYLMHTLEKRLGSYHSHLEYKVRNVDQAHKEDDYHLEIYFEAETDTRKFIEVIETVKKASKDCVMMEIHWKEQMLESESYVHSEEETALNLKGDLGSLEITDEVTEYGVDPDKKDEDEEEENEEDET